MAKETFNQILESLSSAETKATRLDVSPLIQEASSALTAMRRDAGFVNSVWECELWVSGLLEPPLGRWPWPSCGLLRLGEARCERLLSCVWRELSAAMEVGDNNVTGHLLCSKTLVLVWHRRIPLFLFQTICVLWPRCLRFCPQGNDFSPSDVRGLQSLWPEELSLLCCAVRLWRCCFVQICAVLAAFNSTNYITVFMAGCFVLRMDKFLV